MRALIIAGGRTHRGSLSASRALARAGWIVGCGSSTKSTLAAVSRSTRYWHYVPPPEQDLDGFLGAVENAIQQVGYDVVLPSSDAETLALSFGRERIGERVCYPPHEVVVRAFDKLELATGAEQAGLDTPRTVAATADELQRVDGPVIVKSRLHWDPAGNSRLARWETVLASNREEAIRRVQEIEAGGGGPVLQEVLRGRIVHCHAVMDRDGRLATCVQQLSEELTWPSDAGTRTRSKTVPAEDYLVQGMTSFLKELGWRGFASLQFIKPDGGRANLIDFNGRIPLSFEQSLAAGPNLASLWAAVATDRHIDGVSEPRVGVKFHWLEGDLHRALVERRGGLVHDVVDCVRYARESVHGIWRRDDPRPALSYWRHYLARVLEEAAPSVPFRSKAGRMQGTR